MKILKTNKETVKQFPNFNSLFSYLTNFTTKVSEERNLVLSALSHEENQSRSVLKAKRQAILSPYTNTGSLQPPVLSNNRHLNELVDNVPTWSKRESVNIPTGPLKISLPPSMSRKSESLQPPVGQTTEDFSLSPHSGHLINSSIRKFVFKREVKPFKG